MAPANAALNEPFYLNIWLYNPHFIHSQIVVAFRECLDYYNSTFDKSSIKKNFPSHLYGSVPDIQALNWELAIDSDHYWLSELLDDISTGFKSTQKVEAIKSKAYECETVKLSYGEDTVYKVRVGDVWLGGVE